MPELPIMSPTSSGNAPVVGRLASSARKQDDAADFAIALSASMFNAYEVQAGADKTSTSGSLDYKEAAEANDSGLPTGDMDFDVSAMLGIPMNLPPIAGTATLVISEHGVGAGDWRVGPDKPRAGTSGSPGGAAALEITDSMTTAVTAGERRVGPDKPGASAPGSPAGVAALEITESVTTVVTAGDRRLGPNRPENGASASPAGLAGLEITEAVTKTVVDETSLATTGEEAGHGMTTDRHVTGAGPTELIEHGRRGRSIADTSIVPLYEGKNGQTVQNSTAQTPGSPRDPELRAAVDINLSIEASASAAGMAHATSAGDKMRMEPTATRFVATRVESPAWSKDFGLHVIRLTTEGQRTAEIHLNPPDWGPIHVSLKLHGDDATVRMVAEHPGTREALSGAIPHLRDLFEASGLKIADATVNAENQTFTSSGSGSNSFTPSSQQTPATAVLSADESTAEVAIAPGGNSSRSSNRKVDLFA